MKTCIATLASLLAIIACACGEGEPGPRASDITKAAAQAYRASPEPTEAVTLAENGRELFVSQRCTGCHSVGLERSALAGPPLGGLTSRLLAENGGDEVKVRRWYFKHTINPSLFPGPAAKDPAFGRYTMPGYPFLSEEELKALVEYLMTLRSDG